MIQRIQSVFLALVAVCMIAFCFSPVWTKSNDKTADEIVLTPVSMTYYEGSVNEHQLTNISVAETSMLHVLILASIISLLAVLSIFAYRKRVRQLKFGFVNILLIVIVVALLYYQIMEGDKILPHPTYGEYKIGFFLPIAALVFNFLAIHYIKKDEDLVRSADRIR